MLLDEADVADRAKAVVVRGRPVAVDVDLLARGPAFEVVSEASVGDEVDLVGKEPGCAILVTRLRTSDAD